MQLKQLESVKIIAEEGSITKAAEKLFVSQQALSEMLKGLEKELDFKMGTIYIKEKGQSADSFEVLTTNGNPIPDSALKGNIITSDGDGQVEDSGYNINDIIDNIETFLLCFFDK